MPIQELPVSSGSFGDKERVKQAVDIVDLVGSYLQLRRQGRNFVALCPWHDDSRPSLQINPERQSFKCWVCDIGGDVFSFIMKMEGVEFREALEILAERAGIRLEKAPPKQVLIHTDSSDDAAGADQPGNAGAVAIDKRTLMQAMRWAEEQYHDCLLQSPEAAPARRYLEQRGITAESIERFRLGFSPLERDWILRSVKASGDAKKLGRRARILEAVGILARPAEGGSLFDRFRGRVLFSIHDGQGRPVGVGGRVLPELGTNSPAKYVNSPETLLFTKSKLLYALDLAREALRKTRTALVMEGYTDVIVAHQFGFQNAVAALGTAVGESHVRLLKAHADQIILVLDGDEAGTKRANEVLELFVAQQANLRILTLPENLDPCDYLQKYGAESFRDLLETKAVDALDHAFETATRGIDVERDVHGVGQAIEKLLGVIARAPRLGGDAGGDARIREQKILQRLAGKFRVDEAELRRRLVEVRRNAAKRPILSPNVEASAPKQPRPAKPTDPWELALLQLVLARPEFFGQVCERIGGEQFQHPTCRQIYERCCRLFEAGATPSFERLMLEYDDLEIQSLLVELDETAQATGQLSADPQVLLNGLIETFQRKEIEKQRPGQIVALREGGLDYDQQAALLDAIVRQKRGLP